MVISFKLTEEVNRIREVMGLNEGVKHIYQPTGNSCGPTCIKMVGEFIMGNVSEIDDICKTCGTDWVVGTPPEKMKIGLDNLGIKFIEHSNEIEPYQSIRNVIDKGNVSIVRTMTKGVPHWIVIDGYDNDTFNVNDPWLGQIKYNEEELGNIWKVRDYFFYEIIGKEKEKTENVTIRKMTEQDTNIIYNKLEEVFDKTGLSNEEIWEELEGWDKSLSLVALVGDKIAGFYFIGNHPIPKGGEDYEKFKNLKGIEGMGLGVFKEYKNLGVGKKLIETTQQLPVDYIWGYQFKSLKNIDDWLKRRKIYYENAGVYITYQMLKNKETI
jgi:GNAT superfamily N-acetyltransferase